MNVCWWLSVYTDLYCRNDNRMFDGHIKCGVCSDIWSLGCVLYELTNLKHAVRLSLSCSCHTLIVSKNIDMNEDSWVTVIEYLCNVVFVGWQFEAGNMKALVFKIVRYAVPFFCASYIVWNWTSRPAWSCAGWHPLNVLECPGSTLSLLPVPHAIVISF